MIKIDENAIEKLNFLIVGDLMLDHYLYGNCNRISPEAPVPVFEKKSEKYLLGGAGNVVKNLISFGCKCDVLSVLGDDVIGNNISDLLDESGVLNKFIIFEKNRNSTLKQRFISNSQQILRLDSESNHSIEKENQLILEKVLMKNIKTYNAILLSDYAKGVLSPSLCQFIINLANKNSIKVLIDPKGIDFTKYRNAFLLKPNLSEFNLISNSDDKSIAFEEKVEILKSELNINTLLVTLSERGIYYSGKTKGYSDTKATEIFDVSGAGDTVFAAISICLVLNNKLSDICDFANAAASIVIRKFGSQTTTINEILKII